MIVRVLHGDPSLGLMIAQAFFTAHLSLWGLFVLLDRSQKKLIAIICPPLMLPIYIKDCISKAFRRC